MIKATKLYSNVMRFAVVLGILSSISAHSGSMTENQKLVLGNLRLSLWYQGLMTQEEPVVAKRGVSHPVEELDRAMLRYQTEDLLLTRKGSTKD